VSLVLLDSGTAGGVGQDLSATALCSATVSADLKVLHALSATSAGVSTVTALKIDRNRGFRAQPAGVCFVEATLADIRLTASPIVGLATVSSNLRVLHSLQAITPVGVSTVSASLTISSLAARATGTSTVSATLKSLIGLRVNASNGQAATSGNLAVHHELAAVTHGVNTLTAAFSVLVKNSVNVITGQATVTASLGRKVARSATSNLSILAEYQRIVGILMLVDPGFQVELSTPPTAQTFAFVKKMVKGLFYVDIQAAGSALACQVKTGDGQNYNSVVDVSIRTISSGIIPAVISVTSGVLKATGAGACWLQTTSSGAFSVTISGSGPVLVEAFPKQGVGMSTGLSL
jgi:hypothetical protein